MEEKKAKMIAHRGYSSRERENTLAAFIAAGNSSQYGIETDVHYTRDQKLVVIHDDTTGRVSGTNLCVEESDYEDLRNLALYDMDNASTRIDLRIPNLKEYVLICKRYQKTGVLELKNHMPQKAIEQIVETIREVDYLEHVIFISFDMPNLLALRKILPGQPLQFLCEELQEEDFQTMKEHHMDLDIYYRSMSQELVDKIHAMGGVVNCWTVDSQEDRLRLEKMGADYITSNTLE